MLTACAPKLFDAKQTCTTSGVANIYLEDQRDCGCIASQVTLARELLASQGLLPAQLDFASGVTVWIRASEQQLEGQVWGRYWPDWEYIEDSRQNLSLLHELLHHWAEKWLRIPYDQDVVHTDWDVMGYYAASDLFKASAPKCP